ncbi:MAG: C25 family cysteine peptidase [Thermoplasmatota archaeon]
MRSRARKDKASLSTMFVLLFVTAAFSMMTVTDQASPEPSIYEENITADADVEYAMIIGSPELTEEFRELKFWRQRSGYNTRMYDIGEILSTDSGDDDAEKLFNFIDLLYDTTEGKLRYVLLAGDSELIPVRYLHAGASDYGMDDLYLSDVYYSAPQIDWDADDDGIYGEREDIESIGIENISFPVKVGRAPVSNPQQAERFVSRVVSYETDPPEGSWAKEGIVSSSLMDTPNVIDDPETPVDEGYNAYKDNGYKAIVNYTLPYIPRSIDLIEAHDYPEYHGGAYSRENDTLRKDTLMHLLNNGSAFFTFAGQSYFDVEYPVNPYLAYSLAQWAAPGDVSMELGFDIALSHRQTRNLTNGDKLPVAYISSCDTANFSDPEGRDLSNLLYAPGGGSICLIGSTGISWRGEGEDYSLGNWYLMPRFWEQFVYSRMPGEALYASKEVYLDSKWDEYATKEALLVGLYTYNYLGDPALSAWLGEPKNMVVNPISEALFAGKDSYEVEVRDSLGTPLLEARVTLTANGQIFKGITGPDGTVKVPTNFLQGGNGNLTVCAKNFIPYLANITILEEPPDVRAVPGSVSTSPQRPTEGTSMTVTASFENRGDRDLQDVEISLFGSILGSMDEISQADPVSSISADLPAGGSETVSFEVTPLRSWSGITIACSPIEDELIISDNFITAEVHINARPRFLPIETMEILEDSGGREIDLVEYVFEPDEDELLFTLNPGEPSWVTLSRGGLLNVSPPSNWSGTFSVGVKVTDGSAWDSTTFYINVVPVNDAPVLINEESRYEAYVDRVFSVRLETVDAEGDLVDMEISSDLEALKLVGNNLRFVPYEEDIGIHTVNITLSDPQGASTNYTMIIEVIPSAERLYFTEPSIFLPPATEGEPYNHTVTIEGDLAIGARFSDNTSLFDIDPLTGEIAFTPTSEDVGEHWVKITVTNGNTTVSRNFMFRVDEEHRTPSFIHWLLGAGIVILIVLIIMAYLWSGRDMVQYGLEE